MNPFTYSCHVCDRVFDGVRPVPDVERYVCEKCRHHDFLADAIEALRKLQEREQILRNDEFDVAYLVGGPMAALEEVARRIADGEL